MRYILIYKRKFLKFSESIESNDKHTIDKIALKLLNKGLWVRIIKND